MKVYADNAATTRMSEVAADAMLAYMRDNYGNPSSIHQLGREAAQAMQKARETVAGCIGCSPKEIFFNSGGSEGDNQAIITAAEIGAREGKKHIISTAFEHEAVLNRLEVLGQNGFEIELLDVEEGHNITPQQVEAAIRPDTCLVTAMFANNEIGSILPIAEIGAICKKHGVIFHTDAVQAAGHLKIDVQGMNIDMLSISAHKFHGCKGAGALYVRRGITLSRIIEGGAQERGKRAGTENVPGIIAMAAALENECEHLEENSEKTARMRDRLVKGMLEIPCCVLNGDPVNRLPGNANFSFEGVDGETLLLMLDMKGIMASSGSACSSGSVDPSHVLLAIGRPPELAQNSLRLSLCHYNTEEEIDYLIDKVKETVQEIREVSPVWKDYINGR